MHKASLRAIAAFDKCLYRFAFDDAVEAFQATKNGKTEDGKGVIKAIISGPGVSPADA